MKPRRTDDKYWIGTSDFRHITYERDLEDYILDLENKLAGYNGNEDVVTIKDLENFYDQSAEDWLLWEEPTYPIHRVFDAFRKFIDLKKQKEQ